MKIRTSEKTHEIVVPIRSIPRSCTDPDALLPELLARDGINVPFHILKKSIDARHKHDIKWLYRVQLGGEVPHKADFYDAVEPDVKGKKVVIIGSGPAGLFCAYVLAKKGCKPIVFERGPDVDTRAARIAHFMQTRVLDEKANYLCGEGGAGTFSDGKLYTRIHDPRCDFVLNVFAECGAPKEILYLQRPHIGSDLLPNVIKTMREKIIDAGGAFHFETEVEHVVFSGTQACGVRLSGGEEVHADAVVAAVGHSSEAFIRTLIDSGMAHALKAFQIGARIEHPQPFVEKMIYGPFAADTLLSPAEYHLLSRAPTPDLLNVVSFCMCPGGEIIPSTQRKGYLASNGMSPYARDGAFANSALICTLEADRFSNAEEAFAFIDTLEKNCFYRGGENYGMPAQSADGFIRGCSALNYVDDTSYKLGLKSARIDTLLPRDVTASLRKAIVHFNQNTPGFIEYGKVIGIESRVSSPVRFLRSEAMHSTTCPNLYIAGEGAGNAGGIVSAAVDGLQCAEAILGIHQRLENQKENV